MDPSSSLAKISLSAYRRIIIRILRKRLRALLERLQPTDPLFSETKAGKVVYFEKIICGHTKLS